jgi:GNAT superfamily N-acetyltransferase
MRPRAVAGVDAEVRLTLTMAERRREVVRATPGRVGALAPVFGRAFVEEPMTLWSLGQRGDVEARLTGAFWCFLEQVLGLGLVWETTGGRGAAVWVPPDRFEGWAVHPWSHPQIIAVAEDGRRYEAFWDWVGCHHPAQPVWLLDSIAVEPAAQGRGLGLALAAAGLALARADGIGAFLSTGTERNVEIYRRCGFRLAEVADAPEGGPTIYFMRWDP